MNNNDYVEKEGGKFWLQDGQMHRVGAPAVIWDNGQYANFINGKIAAPNFWEIARRRLEMSTEEFNKWVEDTPELVVVSLCEALNDKELKEVDIVKLYGTIIDKNKK